jgi:hypothetical protein
MRHPIQLPNYILVASWNFTRLFKTILYENEFQNPQILMDALEVT